MKTFHEWLSQDQCNEARTSGRLLVLSRVIDGLKKGFGTDNIKDLESLSFTGEMLRSPLPRTGEPHQGQGANLDDETIKAARALGILVPGEHGHLKLVAAEDWRVRGSNYEQPFGGEDDHHGHPHDDAPHGLRRGVTDYPKFGRPGTDAFG